MVCQLTRRLATMVFPVPGGPYKSKCRYGAPFLLEFLVATARDSTCFIRFLRRKYIKTRCIDNCSPCFPFPGFTQTTQLGKGVATHAASPDLKLSNHFRTCNSTVV